MRGWLQHRWASLYLLLLSLAGYTLFLHGFFPLEYQSGRLASLDQLPNFIQDVSIDGQAVYKAEPTTAVLMVVDSLRNDYVTEELMPFTWALLKNKTACEYVALAEPPTVTMPRIKAMMTGRVSTFADVAFNFGAAAVTGDSLLRSAHALGRRAVLYGDDTWLRLFPDLWAEADGTTSFFVSDFTEVDDNVTRHLDRILRPDDAQQPPFDLLVLHYLGLDHIGHLEGAHSPRIAPKLREMDDVVRKIFTAMQTWDREGALMVTGDHGMRDAGGHGGASAPELLVPLVLARTAGFQCPHSGRPGPTVAQTDVAATLAFLLRVPLPADSTGRMLAAVLPADPRQHLYLLHYNALVNGEALARKMGREVLQERECYKQFRRAEEQFARYLADGQAGAARIARHSYEQALDEMGNYLAESTVKFDLFAMALGIVVIFMTLGGLCVVTLHSLDPSPERPRRPLHETRRSSAAGAALAFALVLAVFAAALTLACAVTETSSSLCRVDPLWTPLSAAIVGSLAYTFFVVKAGTEKTFDPSIFKSLNVVDYLLIVGSVVYPLTFVGTSFIEEEHETWYFLWNTLMMCVLVRTAGALVSYATRRREGATELQDKPLLRRAAESVGTKMLPCWLLLIALHRFLRTLNQTGDRWLFLPDTADWLNETKNQGYLHALMLAALAVTFVVCLSNLRHTNNLFQMNAAITIVVCACILLHRVATGSLPAPHAALPAWDPVHVVSVVWGLLAAQLAYEAAASLGAYRPCCAEAVQDSAFMFRRRKEKNEDHESLMRVEAPEDTATADGVKLRLARSLSHVALNTLALAASLLARPHNAPLAPAALVTCALAAACARRPVLPAAAPERSSARTLDAAGLTLLHYWIGCLFYFYQGNSNSLAAVELNAGYVGVREYSPVPVAARIALNTYAGPAIAGASLFSTLATRHHTWSEYKHAVWVSMNVLALLRVYFLAVYTCIAAGFRDHLFVWSVFSPKLLYDMVATTASVVGLTGVAAIFGCVHVLHRTAKTLATRS